MAPLVLNPDVKQNQEETGAELMHGILMTRTIPKDPALKVILQGRPPVHSLSNLGRLHHHGGPWWPRILVSNRLSASFVVPLGCSFVGFASLRSTPEVSNSQRERLLFSSGCRGLRPWWAGSIMAEGVLQESSSTHRSQEEGSRHTKRFSRGICPRDPLPSTIPSTCGLHHL